MSEHVTVSTLTCNRLFGWELWGYEDTPSVTLTEHVKEGEKNWFLIKYLHNLTLLTAYVQGIMLMQTLSTFLINSLQQRMAYLTTLLFCYITQHRWYMYVIMKHRF